MQINEIYFVCEFLLNRNIFIHQIYSPLLCVVDSSNNEANADF